jgi:hypothetical protein
MNDADKLLAHHDDVQIRCRQRIRKFVERLIRQTLHIAQARFAHFHLLATTAGETKHDLRSRFERSSRAQQSVEWMTRAVVTRIHHDELVRQTMCAAKRFPARF